MNRGTEVRIMRILWAALRSLFSAPIPNPVYYAGRLVEFARGSVTTPRHPKVPAASHTTGHAWPYSCARCHLPVRRCCRERNAPFVDGNGDQLCGTSRTHLPIRVQR